MVRLGWKRFIAIGCVLAAITAPLGADVVGAVFALIGLFCIAALIQGANHYRPRYRSIWYIFAGSLTSFLVGGVVEVLTSPADPTAVTAYPGWREPLDLAGYVFAVVGVGLMARARLANRDRTITLDALISMGGVGALAWSVVMAAYLHSPQLTPLGRVTGLTFTMVSLALGFVTVRVAIGPGARPVAYRLMALAVTGAFGSEIFIELQLSGRAQIPGSDLFSTLCSALSVLMIGTAALHPTMAELTEPPADVTPSMTRRRLAAMTIAVLIPPALLTEPARRQNLESLAIIGVWAVLSVMVMVRIFSLARTRERFAGLDRALAAADAALAAAADPDQMAAAVLDGAERILSGHNGIALHHWDGDDGWRLVAARGRSTPLPVVPVPPIVAPVPPGSLVLSGPDSPPDDPNWLWRDGDLVLDLPFWARDVVTGVVTVAAPSHPDSLELARLSLLVSDLGRALESAAMREALGRERSERRFRSLVENSDDIIMVVDEAQAVRFVSPAGPRLLDRSEGEIIDRSSAELVAPDHLERFWSMVERPGRESVEMQLVTSAGALRWFDVSAADMRADPEIAGIVITASEISARKQAQVDLERSEARFRSLVQFASDLVAVLDPSGMISWLSPSATRILGRSPTEVVDRSILDFAHPKDRDVLLRVISDIAGGHGDPADRTAGHEPGVAAARERVPRELELRLADGTLGWRTLEVTVTDLLNEPSVGGIVLNAHDVTERKVLEQNLRHQALHDDLTGLGNRVMFRRRTEEVTDAHGDRFAVLVIDIDDFKTVNDGLGHSVGDDLLRVLASRLTAALRQTDTAVRLGGDEFAVLIHSAHDRADVLATAQRLLQAIEQPAQISGREIALHASIGVAFAADVAAPTPETMLRSADLAMYGAKNRGKGRVAVFDVSMHEGAFERLELKADLARALDRGELLLHYQPVIDLERGTIAGFEALMRWDHPVRGMVGPATFIPLAEETGLIVPIGRWLIEVALTQLRQWQDRFPAADGVEPLSMAVNLSGRQLEDERIVADICAAIARSGVPPSSVIIELTESMLISDSPDLVHRLHDIRRLGVGLHADDFGTGFASYAALQSLPFTGVKIDRSLINGLEGTAVDRAEAQIRSIIEMSSTTGMRVVAEGIESGTQALALRQFHCEHAQGFYFARPAEAAVIEAELQRRATPGRSRQSDTRSS